MSDIILYARGGENEELRYALRTWCKNLNFRHLLAVGGPFPTWFKPDKLINNPTHFPIMRQCHDSLVKALSDDNLSDEVIIMMDDIFLTGRCGDWQKNFNRGTLKAQIERTKTQTAYNRLVLQTNRYLEKLGFSAPLSFEEHAPFICDRRELLDLLTEIEPICGNVLWRSLYGNIYDLDSEYRPDVKYRNSNDKISNTEKIVSTNERSWRGAVGDAIQEWFPVQSKYEK